MGLGKTLQALCVMAAGSSRETPSLIVCPAIVCGHWARECTSRFSEGVFSPLVYAGRLRASYVVVVGDLVCSWTQRALRLSFNVRCGGVLVMQSFEVTPL